MKILIVILMCLSFTGCATSKVATDIGVRIGDTYQEAAAKGIVSAEQSIQAWPYISGQIKGLLASNYEIEVAPLTQRIMDKLDEMAAQEDLTTEDKGFIIGSFVRLEMLALKQSWDRYGVSIFSMVVR